MSNKTKQEQQYAKLAAGLAGKLTEPKPAPEPKPAKARPAKKAKETEPAEKEEQIQISAYIPKTLHKGVKVALASQDEKLTLTDLLIKLLSDWTKKQS